MKSQNLILPFLMPSQAQKHVTHNEAQVSLDTIVQLAVLDRHRTVPPPGPYEGDRHIVASGATGATADHDGDIVSFVGGGWQFFPSREGRPGAAVRRSSSACPSRQRLVSTVENIAHLRVNASADATNRLAVASTASLFTHDGTDHQLTINKATPVSRASVIFQTGYSGRAEIGLLGESDLLCKVSADGLAFWKQFASTMPAATCACAA